MANRFNMPFPQWFNGNGAPGAGYKLAFYVTNTDTPKDTYADSGLSVPNTNPVVANADGVWGDIFLGTGDYKVVLLTAADVVVDTADPVIPVAASPVSSVGLSMPTGIFDVANSPVTSSGTLTVTFDTQSPNQFFAGPASGGAATPSMRAIVEADLPVNVPRSYLAGLTLSRASATTLGVAAGVCRDSTNVQTISLSAGTIDCGTTGANGLDTGALANNTWYSAFAIAKTDGTVARLASTSLSSPTMPSGYTLLRRLGFFKTNGSAQIVDFIQIGDLFRWVTPALDINTTIGTVSGLHLVNVPTGMKIEAILNVEASGTGTSVLVSAPDTTDVASDLTAAPLPNLAWTSSHQGATQMNIVTNTSGQVRGVAGAATTTFRMSAQGWIDRRGRDD